MSLIDDVIEKAQQKPMPNLDLIAVESPSKRSKVALISLSALMLVGASASYYMSSQNDVTKQAMTVPVKTEATTVAVINPQPEAVKKLATVTTKTIVTSHVKEITKPTRSTLQQALTLIQADRSDEAKTLLQSSLRHGNKAIPERAALTELLLSEGKLQAANTLLQQSLLLAPRDFTLRRIQSHVLTQQQAYQAAVGLLQALLSERADDNELIALLATNYQHLGQYQQAAETYLRLANDEPHEAKWWFGLATALQAQQQGEAAITAYQRSLALGHLQPQLQQYALTQIQALNS